MMEIRSAVRENRLSDPSSIVAADYLRYIEAAHIWVCEAGGTVAGFGALDADAASVWALFVTPEAEGMGLGRLLLDRVCAAARAAGLPALHLTTSPGTRAERLYLAAGWQEAAREPDGWLRLRLGL
jgi:GNAT superfamily N-acetyltransferase